MQKNRIFTTFFLFLFWLALPNQIFSQVETLAGFDTLKVLVEGFDPDLVQAGVTETQIQTDVEIKLRQAGFKVKDKEEMFSPYIYLYINVSSNNKNGIFAVSVHTSLTQEVYLDRDKSIDTLASTWDTGDIGLISRGNVRSLRDTISDQVDRFINDYLKANASTRKQSIRPPLPPPPAQTTKQDDSPFTSVYVGGNGPPEVEVFNDSDRTLYLNLGQGDMAPYIIPSKTKRKLTLYQGNYGFKATAPGVSPLEGQKLFEKGHLYYWKFVVITTGNAIPGVSPRRKRRRP
jgi:hypothetical protein